MSRLFNLPYEAIYNGHKVVEIVAGRGDVVRDDQMTMEALTKLMEGYGWETIYLKNDDGSDWLDVDGKCKRRWARPSDIYDRV